MTVCMVELRGVMMPLAHVARLTGSSRQAVSRRHRAGLPLEEPVKQKTRLVDLTGQRFGKLTVLERAANKGKTTRWRVQCDCGSEKTLAAGKLRSGRRTSCEPCARAHIKYEWKITHGQTRANRSTKEYSAWQSMIGRCYRPTNPSYGRYGAIGITVCAEWREAFEPFLAYIGPAPSKIHSVDRIDPLRGYEPGNVRWATPSVQANNRTDNVLITHRGETMTMAQWSHRMGDQRGCIVHKRIKESGWTVEEALDTPYVRGGYHTRRSAACK